MKGASLLAAYRDRQKLDQKQLAKRIGVSEPLVSMWLTRKRRPGRTNALRIEEVTGGAVPASSWDEPEEKPPPRGRRPAPRRAAARDLTTHD